MRLSATTRQWLYTIALALIAILVAYNIIADDQAGVWIALVTALLAVAPVTALRHIQPDQPEYVEKDPTEPLDVVDIPQDPGLNILEPEDDADESV